MITVQGRIFCARHIAPLLQAERKSFEVLTDKERELMIQLMQKQLDTMNTEMEKLWQ